MQADRRRLLVGSSAWLVGESWASTLGLVSAYAQSAERPSLLGAAWRGPSAHDPQFLGALKIDWQQRLVTISYAHPLPSRAHGLVATADGGLLANAARFGAWMLRLDASGQVVARANLIREGHGRRCAGHAVMSPDHQWVYAVEFDPLTCDGYLTVRRADNLATQATYALPGADPHQLLVDRDGHLMIALGGVMRTPDDRKRDLDRMDSSLVKLDPVRGALLGQWRLADPRLSLRHMAWSLADSAASESAPSHAQASEQRADHRPAGRRDATTESTPELLGLALQAEHDGPALRQRAPLLAIWDGQSLSLPERQAPLRDGYAGDITAVAQGFVISCQQAGVALYWDRHRPQLLQPMAQLDQVCALALVPNLGGAAVLASASGVARWARHQAADMLRWPQPMALDNHWVVLGAA